MEQYKEVRDSRIDNWLAITRSVLNMLLFILASMVYFQSGNDVGNVAFIVWIMTLFNLVDGGKRK